MWATYGTVFFLTEIEDEEVLELIKQLKLLGFLEGFGEEDKELPCTEWLDRLRERSRGGQR